MNAAADLRAKCDDCGGVFRYSQLEEVESIYERVAPGEMMPAGECPKCKALCHPYEQSLSEEHYQLFVEAILKDDDSIRSVNDCDLVNPGNRFVIALRGEKQVNDWDHVPELSVIIAEGDSLTACQAIIDEWRDEDKDPIAVCDLTTGMAFRVFTTKTHRLSSLGETMKDSTE